MPLRPPAGFISAFYDPLKVADAPTASAASGGDTQASVTFTAPGNTGGAPITQYYAVSNPGQITGNAASSPVTVTGLTNGTAYTFTVWALNSFGPSPYSGVSGSVTPALPDRGLFGGGSASNIIDYITISTFGNAIDFGDLLNTPSQVGALANSTRGVWAGGTGGVNVIQYIIIATTGNSIDFGDLLQVNFSLAGLANNTRGLFAGGADGSFTALNVIQYITINSAGNSIDFGDLTAQRRGVASANSNTRGLFAGGVNTGFTGQNSIDYITIASTGNAIYFGGLSEVVYLFSGCSSTTRAVFGGGALTTSGNKINVIQYVTISSTGNAIDFGDLLTIQTEGIASCSNKTRGIFAGGADGPFTNTIQYITIASTGNAIDFGDLTAARSTLAACSDCGGGLS